MIKKERTLADTVKLMQSKSYKDRFKAETLQLGIRVHQLDKMIQKYEAGELDFEPTTPIAILKTQFLVMGSYLALLNYRAELEGISLEDGDSNE